MSARPRNFCVGWALVLLLLLCCCAASFGTKCIVPGGLSITRRCVLPMQVAMCNRVRLSHQSHGIWTSRISCQRCRLQAGSEFLGAAQLVREFVPLVCGQVNAAYPIEKFSCAYDLALPDCHVRPQHQQTH